VLASTGLAVVAVVDAVAGAVVFTAVLVALLPRPVTPPPSSPQAASNVSAAIPMTSVGRAVGPACLPIGRFYRRHPPYEPSTRFTIGCPNGHARPIEAGRAGHGAG